MLFYLDELFYDTAQMFRNATVKMSKSFVSCLAAHVLHHPSVVSLIIINMLAKFTLTLKFKSASKLALF